MLIGYAHVWIADQNLAQQRRALTDAGCAKIFTEHVSDAGADCPALPAVHGRHGRCRKLDRRARSERQLIEAVDA